MQWNMGADIKADLERPIGLNSIQIQYLFTLEYGDVARLADLGNEGAKDRFPRTNTKTLSQSVSRQRCKSRPDLKMSAID